MATITTAAKNAMIDNLVLNGIIDAKINLYTDAQYAALKSMPPHNHMPVLHEEWGGLTGRIEMAPSPRFINFRNHNSYTEVIAEFDGLTVTAEGPTQVEALKEMVMTLMEQLYTDEYRGTSYVAD